jgi:hypothetical protein
MGNPSSAVRNADGHTFSPVFELINSEPRMPGIMITGRFPVFARATAKMCSRFGVRRAEIHPDTTKEKIIRRPAEKIWGVKDFALSLMTAR